MLYHNPTLTPYHTHVKQDPCQEIDRSSSPVASSSYYGYPTQTAETRRPTNCDYEHELYRAEYECDTDSTVDKMQWQAWLDEVRNLIIFAGLLSAIVTPFIIESNKKLKPTANETIVSLLAQIVSSTGNTTPDADAHIPSTPISPLPHTFTPNPAHVRANTFWLISLILSLTVILVGSLVIQWLRACRSYTLPSFSVGSGGQSPLSPLSPLFKLNFESKFDSYSPTSPSTPTTTRRLHAERPGSYAKPPTAKYNLRLVLATLPLFLQLSVVLFLGGLMDFVQIFGDCAVLVSVSAVVLFGMWIWRMGVLQ